MEKRKQEEQDERMNKSAENEEREYRNGKREERNVPEMRWGGKEEGEEKTETGNERRAGNRVRAGVCDMSELWTWLFPLLMKSWNYWQGN